MPFPLFIWSAALTLLLLLSCFSFLLILLFLGFYYFLHIKPLLQQQITAELEIKKSHENEQKLQQALLTLQKKLQLAIEDPVTGLTGWQIFTDRLNQSIHESRRYQFTMAVLYVDMDQFRIIHEALGQQISDLILQEVAKRLQTCIRQVDSITRLTKDTFVVLLTQLNKSETAAIVAQRMLQSLVPPIYVDTQSMQVSACIGIALFPTDGEETADLLRNAENALQRAKANGSQVYQFYQAKIQDNSTRELDLLTRLKGEFTASEFEIYYQPIMDLRTDSVVCMDAHLYWHHPKLGLVNSKELSHYTEKLGKTPFFTEWVFQQAYGPFLAWRESSGSSSTKLGLFLTLSQLKNTNFIYKISQWLQETHFKPEWLLLEIQAKNTEAPFVLEDVEKAFNMFSYLHIQLAVEKAGAGPFVLLDLKKAPFHYLKLSQSLLYHDHDENGPTEQGLALVKAVIALAESLGMQLIIQDIESAKQVDFFKTGGCHLLQGPFICQPLPLEEIKAASIIA